MADLPSDRRRAYDLLFFEERPNWRAPFALMLLLSAGIATLGLSENSAATVIGAMVVAPLGQPIVALGAATAIGWRSQMFELAAIVVAGAVAVIAVAFALALVLPQVSPNEQMLARTSPDLRDLGIAILAGAAGAYGYYRAEFSSVLAGVAIAVALVPPLCVVGLTLEQGQPVLAWGGMLLFLTNFVGIALSSLVVFFATGTLEMPGDRKWFARGLVLTLALTAAVLVPLTVNYDKVVDGVTRQTEFYAATEKALAQAHFKGTITSITHSGTALAISLRPAKNASFERGELTSEIERATGMKAIVSTGAQ